MTGPGSPSPPEDLEARLRALEAVVLGLEARLGAVEARARGREEAAADFRRALGRLGDALGFTHDRPAMVGAFLDTAALLMGAEVAVFFELVPGTDRLRAIAVHGPGREDCQLAFGEGIAGTAAALDGVVLRPPSPAPTASDPVSPATMAAAPPPAPAEPEAGDRTAVALPVRSGRHPYGVLALYGRTEGRRFTPEDVEVIQTLVRQAETAIENTFLYDESKRLSLTDGLTGLWNYRHFDLNLGDELARAVRFGESFSLVMIDVDSFKAVNDGYGHEVGHGVLVELARRLMDSTREVDLVARLGGDEFALLLPRTGLAGAIRLAEKVRARVADEPFVVDGQSLSSFISLGVATYPEHGDSGKELREAADGALYGAKKLGGNRVEHARTPRPGEPGGQP